MENYHSLLKQILEKGDKRQDRTGVGTLSLFGHQLRWDLAEGFPLLTTKRLHLKSIIHELLWFLRGETNVRSLQAEGVKIWDEWADERGELGPVYGHQWRSWPDGQGGSIDQLAWLLEELRQRPYSRRLVVSAWNVADLSKMALAPCHCLFQFHVAQGRLSCQLYQRSADAFLGLPFNIASYALLTSMLAQVLDLKVGDFIHTLGDVHLYLNHLEQTELLLSRAAFGPPSLRLNPEIKDLFGFAYEDIVFENYQAWPNIKAEVAV